MVMGLALPRALGKSANLDPGVALRKFLGTVDGFLRSTVTDDTQLEFGNGLRQNAVDRKREQVGGPYDGKQNRKTRYHDITQNPARQPSRKRAVKEHIDVTVRKSPPKEQTGNDTLILI